MDDEKELKFIFIECPVRYKLVLQNEAPRNNSVFFIRNGGALLGGFKYFYHTVSFEFSVTCHGRRVSQKIFFDE